MIKEKKLILKYVIQKEAYCDDCNVELHDNNTVLMSDPPKKRMICPKCRKDYYIYLKDLQDEYIYEEVKEDPLQN